MNFFEHQARAKAQSRWMVWAFAVSVALTVVGVMAILAATFALGAAKEMTLADAVLPQWPVLLTVGIGVALAIAIGSLFKISQLKTGGGHLSPLLRQHIPLDLVT